MVKNVHAFLKFINLLACIALIVLWVLFGNKGALSFNDSKSPIDSYTRTQYGFGMFLLILTLFTIILSGFYKLKYNQVIFVGITCLNLLLIFIIIAVFTGLEF